MAAASSADLAHVFVGSNAISNAFCANSACAVATSQSQRKGNGMRFDAAFAAKNAVALVSRDPKNAELLKIEQTLQHRVATGDATRITSVFLNSTDAQDRVFAGDSEGNVFLWQRESTNCDHDEWELINLSSVPASSQESSESEAASAAPNAMKRLSTSSVAAVAAAETSRRWIYFVSFSNGTLVAFEQDKQQQSPESVRVLAQLDLGVRFIMESLAVSTIDLPAKGGEANVLLAAGGVDSKVHLYEVPGGATRLHQLLVLEGHRGWIRGLSFEKQQHSASPENASRSLFLASASQDQRIRLWKVTAEAEQQDSSSSPSSNSTVLATNETRDGFQATGVNCSYTVSFDALLIGHEDWVTSLEWTLVPKASSTNSDANESEGSQSYESALVSSSMDNALIVWRKNMRLGVSGAWFPSLRVGEMGGNGILKGIVLPSESDRLELLALNFMGQLERWKQQPSPSKIFLPSASLTGHCSTVTDLSWSPSGDYLLSVSLDQTARVLAPLKKEGHESWHEISRAQVHGYDLNCACFLLGNDRETTVNDRFVSGADEKILRVFEAPDDIQSLVRKLSGQVSESESESSDASREQQPRVQHAYLPELSLTNKTPADASTSTSEGSSESSNGGYAAIDVASPSLRLPVGDTLGKKTLWPEQRKLYGHGNELLCVASNHSGSLIASACKSREERFASIWLWNTSDWSVAQAPLEGHKSSVVQLAFSPNDQFLVSVSRDRHFCVYEKKTNGDGTSQFALVEKLRAHKRIIWSCSWSPDSRFFATASRDQTFALWGQTAVAAAAGASSGWSAVGKPVSLESAVTAIAFAPLVSSQSYVVAVGLESGVIKFFSVAEEGGGAVEIKLLSEVELALSPSATVTRLAWSPHQQKQDDDSVFMLAASSSDYSVRLYNVQLNVHHGLLLLARDLALHVLVDLVLQDLRLTRVLLLDVVQVDAAEHVDLHPRERHSRRGALGALQQCHLAKVLALAQHADDLARERARVQHAHEPLGADEAHPVAELALAEQHVVLHVDDGAQVQDEQLNDGRVDLLRRQERDLLEHVAVELELDLADHRGRQLADERVGVGAHTLGLAHVADEHEHGDRDLLQRREHLRWTGVQAAGDERPAVRVLLADGPERVLGVVPLPLNRRPVPVAREAVAHKEHGAQQPHEAHEARFLGRVELPRELTHFGEPDDLGEAQEPPLVRQRQVVARRVGWAGDHFAALVLVGRECVDDEVDEEHKDAQQVERRHVRGVEVEAERERREPAGAERLRDGTALRHHAGGQHVLPAEHHALRAGGPHVPGRAVMFTTESVQEALDVLETNELAAGIIDLHARASHLGLAARASRIRRASWSCGRCSQSVISLSPAAPNAK